MFGHKTLACSFCGRGESQVAKLVAGPKVYICDECVALASRIMKESGEPPRAEARRSVLRAFVQRVRGAWLFTSGRSLKSSQATI